MRVFPVLYMEAEKNRLKPVSFPFRAFMVQNSEKGECSAPLWSFNFLSKLIELQIVYGFVRILIVVRYIRVVYPTTKVIQIKPYTICSSHQLGLEVKGQSRT